MEKLAVVLIRNDRRIHDHEALFRAREFDQFLILATYPPQWDEEGRMSQKRKEFTQESLNRFAKKLGKIPLHFAQDFQPILEKLSHAFNITVLTEEQGSTEEDGTLKKIQVPVLKTRPNTVFLNPKLYPTFTPFRSNLEKYGKVDLPIDIHALDPEKSIVLEEYLFKSFPVGEGKDPDERVHFYLNKYLESYEDTRNYLEDENGSSRFSFYLSTGELSARSLYQEIEKRNPGNWLNVELLWRDFFWHHKIDFTLPSRGRKINGWENKISHPLARAIYHELIETGYISNRSRQILASYLIYDLGLDWKEGAAFYEKHLLDYDVFVNWGNWQYIAGVKFDPRGGRKFNLDLQVEKYDPTGAYMKKWNLP